MARRQDIEAIDALFRRAYPRLLKADYPPSVQVLAIPRLARANPALVASGRYYVAEIHGEIIGAGGWSPDRRSRGLAHVRHVVTSDRHLRQGIGRAVLSRVISEAQASGHGRLLCWSTRTAAPFYAALGFRALGAIEVPLAPGIVFPAIEMERKLEARA